MVGDKRWKRHEREIASAMEGIRLPNSGRGQADIIAGNVAVQVKTRKALPSWLTASADQARNDAPDGMVPVVVLSDAQQGRKARRFFMVELEYITGRGEHHDHDPEPSAVNRRVIQR